MKDYIYCDSECKCILDGLKDEDCCDRHYVQVLELEPPDPVCTNEEVLAMFGKEY